MRWSISAHRSFRRCPRQYYFNHMAAAWNATKMPWRREAHLLKQVKSVALWRGSLVSLMMERVGCGMLANGAVDSEQLALWVWELAERQYAFSEAGRFREATKTAAGDAYCRLEAHEWGPALTDDDIAQFRKELVSCCGNVGRLGHVAPHLVEARLLRPASCDDPTNG